MITIYNLLRIAEIEYKDIIRECIIFEFKLRIILIDESFIDINISRKLGDKFGFHWETRNTRKDIYRYDNFPDIRWTAVETFPFHFHRGSQNNVEKSPFSCSLPEGFRDFMNFISENLKK